jgi:hypothetical protein
MDRYRIIKPCIRQVALLSRILPSVEIKKKKKNQEIHHRTKQKFQKDVTQKAVITERYVRNAK